MTRLKQQSLELESVRTRCHTDRSWYVQNTYLHSINIFCFCLSNMLFFLLRCSPSMKSGVGVWKDRVCSGYLSPLYKQFLLSTCPLKTSFPCQDTPHPQSLEVESWRTECHLDQRWSIGALVFLNVVFPVNEINDKIKTTKSGVVVWEDRVSFWQELGHSGHLWEWENEQSVMVRSQSLLAWWLAGLKKSLLVGGLVVAKWK